MKCIKCGRFIGKNHTCNFHSIKTKKKMSLSKLNEKNSQWKGKNVGYSALHEWVTRHKPKPEFCEQCKEKPAYDLANISGEYKRDTTDYEWLCRKCHMIKDGRMGRLIKRQQKKRKRIKVNCNYCGKIIEIIPYKTQYKTHFCGQKCYLKNQRKRNKLGRFC